MVAFMECLYLSIHLLAGTSVRRRALSSRCDLVAKPERLDLRLPDAEFWLRRGSRHLHLGSCPLPDRVLLYRYPATQTSDLETTDSILAD